MDNFECLTLQNISKMDINQDFAQKYLEYLVKLIHLNKPIDFIQAALVMQTLSSVFAKKVDSLQEQILAFTIVFRKLELGNNAGEDGADGGESQEKGKAHKRKNIEKETIMHAFENVCTKHNIRKSFVKNWSDKDIKKVDPHTVRSKISECSKIKTKDTFSCYIYDNKHDKLGKKEEFGVNGILCNSLVPKDDFCIPCPHMQDFQKCNETVNMSLFTAPVPLPNEDDNHHMDVEPMHSPMHDTGRHSYQDVVEEFLNNSEHNKDHSTTGHVYFEKMNQVQERLVDVGGLFDIMWAPIGDDNKLLEKKIKKRNVLAIPEDLKKKEDGKKYQTLYPTEYVLSDIMLALFKVKSNVPLHPHFTQGLRAEKEFRTKQQPKKNAKRAKTAITDIRNDVEKFKGFSAFGENDGEAFERELDVDIHDDPDLPGNEDYIDEAFQQIRELQQGLLNQQDETMNDIALKVSSWHDSIRPHLEREEGRTNFDIHEYGSKILNQFPKSRAKTTRSFADCVRNQPREEIPRYFLSSLLLANSNNVDISRENKDELGVNDVMLTLLSRVRQHEVLDEGLRKDLS